jgi:undecaprenyl-diphosphatase
MESVSIKDWWDRGEVTTAVITLLAVGAGGLLVRHSTLDLSVTYWANTHHTGLFGDLTTAVYLGLRSPGAVLLTAVTALLLSVCLRSCTRAVEFAATALAIWLPVMLIKPLFARPRPDPHELAHPLPLNLVDYSYISGHTVFMTAFVLALSLALRGTAAHQWVVWLGTVAVAGICVVVLTNGVHYPSDVAGALIWVVGTFPLVSRTVVFLMRRRVPQRVSAHSGVPSR